jgi:hypothetical protein
MILGIQLFVGKLMSDARTLSRDETGYKAYKSEFMECFPSVARDLARQVLECSEQALLPSAAVQGFCLALKPSEPADKPR